MSALTFPAEPTDCDCGEDDSIDVRTGRDCELLNQIYTQLRNNKIYALNPRWFLTFLVTEIMSPSTLNRIKGGKPLEYAYARVLKEMVSIIGNQVSS